MLVINPSMRRFTPNLNTYVMTVLLETIHDLKERFKNLGYALLTGIQNSSCTSAIVHERGDQPYDTSKAGTSEGKKQFENPWCETKELKFAQHQMFFCRESVLLF